MPPLPGQCPNNLATMLLYGTLSVVYLNMAVTSGTYFAYFHLMDRTNPFLMAPMMAKLCYFPRPKPNLPSSPMPLTAPISPTPSAELPPAASTLTHVSIIQLGHPARNAANHVDSARARHYP